MTPLEFEKRLEDISTHKGVPYERLRNIAEDKDKHFASIRRLRGYVALSDAFKCFFLETVERVNIECHPRVKTPLSASYPLFLARLSQSFSTLCGAERIAQAGYPYQAYTLLRNVFDNDVLTSAALLKLTDFLSIEGVTGVQSGTVDMKAIRKLRKDVELKIRRQMTGQESGLRAETLSQLSTLNDLFDYETHGARLSLARNQDWLRGKAPLRVTPLYNQLAATMFVNRFLEIAWMGHRLVPALQPPEAPLPKDWANKWKIIDDSFLLCVTALTQELGKPIGAAIREFVSAKFPYNESSYFPL